MEVKNLRAQRRYVKLNANKGGKKELTLYLPVLPPSNKVNIYDCGTHENVTVDRFVGVTPFVITCPHCKRPATSRWYRVDQSLMPEFEWTQPEPKELGRLPRQLVEHLIQGGLMLKKIKT